ncbi:MAG: hypothetical protein FWC45_01220 [Treponema sp.]|nr:hypothetical protein [Treponema sp.]
MLLAVSLTVWSTVMIPLAGTVTVGGIIARNSGTVNHCYAAASIIGNTNRPDIEIVIVGGVVGVNEGVIKNCVALNPSISGTNSNAGRVVGSNSSTLVNNYASNNITMSSSGYVAAIAKDKKDGETITPEQYNNKGWWITPSNWEFSDPWDFANNWKWGANNLPY